jgi:hypothetical protein
MKRYDDKKDQQRIWKIRERASVRRHTFPDNRTPGKDGKLTRLSIRSISANISAICG